MPHMCVTHNPEYVCPICLSDLCRQNKTWVCENKHAFDIAKEGYVNLLPVQQKKSKEPGDNKAMIQCRKNFLEKRFYDRLIDPCAQIIDALIVERFDDCRLLDVGCGDGFFTREIFAKLTQSAFCYGIDISKEAIKISAKGDKNISWAVASSNNLPFKEGGIDIMLKINAPLNYSKNFTKLSDNGIVMSITPGEAHLYALKSIIYEQAQFHKKEACPEGYALLSSTQINQKIQLNHEEDIKNLFMMTPFFWNASQANKDKINGLHYLETDIAFDIQVWSKQ